MRPNRAAGIRDARRLSSEAVDYDRVIVVASKP